MNAGTKTVTDIDHLISLGYAPSEVRKTLQLTKGDKNAALSILARGIRKEDESWRKESADDWLNGVSSNVPKHEQNRALQKSPVYIRISKYHRLDYDVEYIMNITLRNGKQWVVGRTYNQFSVFKQNLPLGTCMKFINAFPMPNFFQFFYAEDTTEFLEKRRDMLGEWIREMSLNEECMTSPRVLELLTSFIDLPVHCGPGASLLKPETFSAQQSPTNSDAQKAVASGTESYSSPLLTAFSTNDFEFRKTTILQNIPLIDDQRFPLTLHDMSSALPYKVELKRLQCGREHVAARRAAKEKSLMKAQADGQHATADENGSIAASPVIDRDDCCIVVDEKQLGKDLSRDRLVVQGKKVPGSLVSLEEIVDLCKQTILQVIVKSGHQLSAVKNSAQQSLVTPPPPPPGNYNGRPAADTTAIRASASLNVLDQVSKAALQQICRTESAFLSHTSLNEMLDLENRRQLESFMPFLVVPESALADPLVLNFRVQERVAPEKSSSSSNLRKVGSNLNVLNSVDVPVAVPVSNSSSSNIGSSHAAVVPEPSPTSYCTNNNSFYHTGEPHNNRYQQQSSSSSLHEWCLVCEGEAATVYRLLDPESMEAVLQLKVTYMHTLFAHPVIESTARAEKVTDFRLREGKTYLVLSRDTTATARDWDKR